METMELHCGRLVDHIQLVVSDLDASRRFYEGVLAVLGIPIGGSGEGFFSTDELAVSSRDSDDSAGELTGRQQLARPDRHRATGAAVDCMSHKSRCRDNRAPSL